MAKEIDESAFEASVVNADGLVLVDFYGAACPPCMQQAPILDAWGTANEGKVEVFKLNVGDAPMLASRFGVMGVPTLILFRGGNEIVRAVGLQNETALDDLLARAAS